MNGRDGHWGDRLADIDASCYVLDCLPKEGMYADDFEGTVDGAHPNDWGMMHMAAAYGGAVRRALGLAKPVAPGK